MIIDIYTHILPARYFQAMNSAAPELGDIGMRMRNLKLIHDLDGRFRLMDEMSVFGDYRQVLSLPNPPIEEIADATLGAELARIGNDAMAELVARHPDRFPAFVAALSLHDMDAALAEADRAVRELNAAGVQIFTNMCGQPLDQDRFFPLFQRMAEHDLPVWLHPTRTAAMADYAAEPRSRYEMWWCFGWPYETSVAMLRLALWGLFDRLPALKIVTHHLGAMIPYFDGRIMLGARTMGTRTTDEDYGGLIGGLQRPLLDTLKLFYADTAMCGTTTGLKCGIEFFGDAHVTFSTDCPFAPVKETIESIGRLGLDDAARQNIWQGNAERLTRRRFG